MDLGNSWIVNSTRWRSESVNRGIMRRTICLYIFRVSAAALTNEDFRKLLMTPRSGVPSVAPPSTKSSSHSSKSVPSSIYSHRSSRWAVYTWCVNIYKQMNLWYLNLRVFNFFQLTCGKLFKRKLRKCQSEKLTDQQNFNATCSDEEVKCDVTCKLSPSHRIN